ncbi:MAG TPA: PQQ-binding-like beta-propeller repeat protein [Iamia sp.]|nr:PQQ-binding-like beta-propeller repeat protein [Iamia sp.]
MADGSTSDSHEEVAALAAVWGREASATAPPAPRPDLDAVLGPERSAAQGGGREGRDGRERRRGRTALLFGAAVAVVALVLVALVVVEIRRDEPPEPAADAEAGATTTTEALTTGPAWAADVTCLPVLDGGAAGISPACPVATDDERAYVLVGAAGVPVVRAFDVVGGEVAWEQPAPVGARDVLRLPSIVAVIRPVIDDPVDPLDPEVAALDPTTGAERWRRPGALSGPLGRDHLLLDHAVDDGDGTATATMAVVEAATGRSVFEEVGPSEATFLHPCGEAGLVLASVGEQLTARGVADGVVRWSVEAPHLGRDEPLRCDDRHAAFLDGGSLRLLDLASGADVGTTTVAPEQADDRPEVLALAADTVMVGSTDGVRGFRADADLDQLWRLRCRWQCGSDLPAGPAGEDVVVVIDGVATVRSGADGGSGPTLDLDGRTVLEMADGTLLAWGRSGVVLADTAELGRPVFLDVDDVRQAAAGPTHLVVSSDVEVRAYPR